MRLDKMSNSYEIARQREAAVWEKNKQLNDEARSTHEKKVETLKAQLIEFVQENQDGLLTNEHLFSWACARGQAPSFDNCRVSGQNIPPDVRSDRVGEVLIIRRLSVLLDEIRGLRQDINSSPRPPENKRVGSGNEDLKEELGNSQALQSQLFSSLLQEVRHFRQAFEKQSELLPEVRELKQALRSQQYTNRFFFLGCACLGALVLLLFK